MLITSEQFDNAQSRDLIPLECEYCHETFCQHKHYIQTAISKTGNCKARFCGMLCANAAQKKNITVFCTNCSKEFRKRPSQIKRYPNHFCCRSCAATYNNKHKTTGTRRSKLEVFLEEQITSNYPQLNCLFNDKKTIGSELDFYFPSLKLAVELNGIFHYEPIYGSDKLTRIQDNDKQKSIRCYELGIEFCTIDTSSCIHLTDKQKDKYWNILNSLLTSVFARH